MPLSYQTQTSPSTTSFTVTFPVLSLTDIKAVGKNTGAADWSELAVTNPTSINGVTTCTVTEAPNYDSVRIYRRTGNTALVDFQNGSRLSESDLDTAYNHSLFAAQEVTENAGENIMAKGDTGAAGTDGADAVITTGSISNDKLENSSVTINGSAVPLGGSTTVGGGKIGQVVQSVKTDTFTTTSTSFIALTGLTASITPTASNSKILVSVNLGAVDASGNIIVLFQLLRGDTVIGSGDPSGSISQVMFKRIVPSSNDAAAQSAQFLDSPSSMNQITYSIKCKTSEGTMYINRSSGDGDSSDYGRTISTITLMEILP